MKNGVFDHRLQRKLRDLIFRQFIRDIRNKGDSVMETHVLEFYIDRDMLLFLADGRDTFLPAQCQLVKFG